MKKRESEGFPFFYGLSKSFDGGTLFDDQVKHREPRVSHSVNRAEAITVLSIGRYAVVLFLALASLAPFAHARDAAFEQTLYQVLTAFEDKDIKSLSQLIHPDEGFYLLTSPGAYYGYRHSTHLEDLKDGENFSYQYASGASRAWGEDLTSITEIKITKLAMYDGFYASGWSEDYPKQKAILVSRMGIDHPFYDFMKMVKTMRDEHFPESEPIPDAFVQHIKTIDQHTRKVEVYNNTRDCLLSFYLILIEGEWYLLAIDGVTWGDA